MADRSSTVRELQGRGARREDYLNVYGAQRGFRWKGGPGSVGFSVEGGVYMVTDYARKGVCWCGGIRR